MWPFSQRQFCCMMSGCDQQDEDNCWYTEPLVQWCVKKNFEKVKWSSSVRFIAHLNWILKFHPKAKCARLFFFSVTCVFLPPLTFAIQPLDRLWLWANQSRRWMLHYGPISFSLAERLIKWFGLLLAEGGWRLLSAFAAEGITAS